MKSLYEILGISPEANLEQVRAAYRAKVKIVHPDTGGSSDAFSAVTLAYEILSDDHRRKEYDATWHLDDHRDAVAPDLKSRQPEKPVGFVDLSAFGRPVDPLFDTRDLASDEPEWPGDADPEGQS
jgi:curved DNA-binding protein CbpA